ncbi:DUF2800 domain-containing protein [Desulfosporosinus burensis]
MLGQTAHDVQKCIIKHYFNCTPSVRLEESFADKTSTFMEEGTAATCLIRA